MKKIAKVSKKNSVIALAVVLMGFFALTFTFSSSIYAQTPPAPTPSSDGYCKDGEAPNDPKNPCVSLDAKTIQENAKKAEEARRNATCSNKNDCGNIITKILNPFIKLMTVAVGLVIAASLIFAGITYSAAGGDPSKVQAAKERIRNTIIALIGYLFSFSLLQWLIPGGIV